MNATNEAKPTKKFYLGFVRESSERKATQAKKNGQQFGALASALIPNINQTNQASK
jgi:hypothetical protein